MTRIELLIQALLYMGKVFIITAIGIAIIVGFVYGMEKLTDYLDDKGIK